MPENVLVDLLKKAKWSHEAVVDVWFAQDLGSKYKYSGGGSGSAISESKIQSLFSAYSVDGTHNGRITDEGIEKFMNDIGLSLE